MTYWLHKLLVVLVLGMATDNRMEMDFYILIAHTANTTSR